MAKFRKRVNRTKGKRWAKGQSSSSNPSTNKYRDAAKSRFFEPLTGPSMLTKDAMIKHDSKSYDYEGNSEADDIESFEGRTLKTFDTFASNFSACSNQSFNKLITKFRSDSAIHKDMLAVLAAITEVIKENGGNESSTEYFGALITALESEGNTDDNIAAIVNLLSMGIKSVPQSVLQTKFSEASSILMNTLAKFYESEKVSIMRAILGCLSVLLRSLESSAWGDSSTLNILDGVLEFLCFSKPKVRKAAVHGINVVVRGSNITQSALSHIAKHCIKLVGSVATGSITTTLHTFALLKDIIHTFPKKELKECCESVLSVMHMKNILLISCGLQVFHGMFLGKPAALTGKLACCIIEALYDYQPSPTDNQPTLAWLAVLKEGYLFLAKDNLGLCIANCSKLFRECTLLYLTNKPETMTAVTHSLQVVISDCIGLASQPDCLNNYKYKIFEIFDLVHKCLTVQDQALPHILHLISALFKACGSTCSSNLLPCVKTLFELRDSEQLQYINELENAIGIAIRTMGPDAVLRYLPFDMNYNNTKGGFHRSWLIPIMKDNIKGATLEAFKEHFFPIADICDKNIQKFKQETDHIKTICYELLLNQVWALLPSFATDPTDIIETFPTLAKAFGGMLMGHKNLRNVVFSTLRKLITFCSQENKGEELATIQRYAKNFLPILFVIYTTKPVGSDDEGTRLACYETIKVYLKISSEELKRDLYNKAYNKIRNKEADHFLVESVLDIIRALLPYQSKDTIKELFETIKKVEECKNHKLQKKYFRIIEEICASESETLSNFLNENINEISTLLLESMGKTATSTKGARLRCLFEILQKVDDPQEFALQLLPETIICVKDVNQKCKESAFKILEFIANNINLKAYLPTVMAGLAGSPSLMTCSLLALAAVAFHVSETISEEDETYILYNVGLLAVCPSREVASAALSFLKVYIQSFPRYKVGKFLPKLMEILSAMTDDCKRHNRTKTRDILSRLCRWFGSDEVINKVPASDEVLRVRVRNLGKIQGRKKRQREASRERSISPQPDTFSAPAKHRSIEEILADSDSEMDIDDDDEKKGANKKKDKFWINEEGEDIIDFTDTKSNQKITGTKPETFTSMFENNKIKKNKSGFKTTHDGRLIITDFDNSDDDDNSKKKKKTLIPGLDDNNDDYEMSDSDDAASAITSVFNGKRKRGAPSVTSSSSYMHPEKYQAGGTGIHRPINRAASVASSRRSNKSNTGPQPKLGNEYKAKKAGGDVKRKGMPDPYAYIPLRRDAINKRKRMKNMSQIKSIIKAAQSGTKIGSKQKKKN